MKSYGTVTYNNALRVWEIDTEPHVVIRLKRWFARIESTNYGRKHRIAANPENSRDLEGFLYRFPHNILPSEQILKELADAHRERQNLVEKLLHGLITHEPFPLKLPLREYQQLATTMWLTTGGLLLADDVGLGKTAIAVAGLTDPKLLPAMVVTLTHLPWQWQDEIHKFTDLRCHVLKKGQPYDLLDKDGRMPDVIISNYHKLSGWAGTLDGIIKSITFDEVHELRHKGTAKYEAAEQLAHSVNFRIGLSGTPIMNYGGEIWNVFNILCPDILGTEEEFQRQWCTWRSNKALLTDPAAFGVYARELGVMLRRTRKEVKRELPSVIRIPHQIDCDPKVFENLKGDAIELAKLILKQSQEFKGQKLQAAGEFNMRMRQITGISKAPYVAKFVRWLIEENDTPVVLYGFHRECYSIWLEEFKGNERKGVPNLNPVMFTGSESPQQKELSKQAFINGESKVMIISLRAGAGMNGLQDVCHVCVFGELDWAHGIFIQAEGRLHRDGQDEPVTSYYLVSDQGSDPVMMDVLGIKKQQAEGFNNPSQDTVSIVETDPEHIKKLAEKYLYDHGISIPGPEEIADNPQEAI